MQEILKSYRNHLRSSKGFTQETVEKYLGNLLLIFRELSITEIGQLQAEKINQAWLANIWHVMQTKRGLSDNTVISYQSALKSFFKFLENNGQLNPGSANEIKLAKATQVHVDGLSYDQKLALREYLVKNLKTNTQRRDAALIFFLWATGCRIREALRLIVHDEGMIYLDNPLTRSGDFFLERNENGKYDFFVHLRGKGKKDRNIAMAPEALWYINLYLELREIKSSILFINHAHNRDPNVLSRTSSYRTIEYVCKKAGIDKPAGNATHICRHTAIEEWIRQGYSDQKIIMMTGHSSPAELEKYRRRSRRLTIEFANEGNALRMPGLSKEVRQFEEVLRTKYLRS
jgi:site-specific recombinase XerD